MMSDIAVIYKPAELMRVLGLGRNTVYALLRSGRLRSIKIGSRYLVTQEALHEFLNENKHASQEK